MLLHYWQFYMTKNQISVAYNTDHRVYQILIIGMQNQKVMISFVYLLYHSMIGQDEDYLFSIQLIFIYFSPKQTILHFYLLHAQLI
jgi:hypothetical protein